MAATFGQFLAIFRFSGALTKKLMKKPRIPKIGQVWRRLTGMTWR